MNKKELMMKRIEEEIVRLSEMKLRETNPRVQIRIEMMIGGYTNAKKKLETME